MDLIVRPLSYVEQMSLAEDVGFPRQSQEWWATVSLAAAIRSIDGKQITFPQTESHVERILERLGDAGILAARKLHSEYEYPEEPALAVDLRPLNGVERLRLARISEYRADIRPWYVLAYTACGVRTIEGNEVKFPTTIKEIRALVKTLGRSGMDAADVALKKPDDDEAEAEKSEATQETIKN